MSTIPDNPFDASKPESFPASPTTADQRGQHSAGNAAFAAAKSDITALEGHVADTTGNPHNVLHAQTDPNALEHVNHQSVNLDAGAGLTGGGTIELSRTFAVGAGEGITVNVNDVAASWAGSGGDLGAATTVARSDHLHDVRYYPRTEADSVFLKTVAEDLSPQLGGDLESKGNQIRLTRIDDTVHGIMGAGTTFVGAYFAYNDGTPFSQDDGAVVVAPAQITLGGTSVVIAGQQHTTPGGRQAYISESGVVYGVDPPEPGWTLNDTSTDTQDLGTGDTTGPWYEIGLSVTLENDVQAGDRLDVSVNVNYENRTDDKPGQVSIGFGIDAADPTETGATFTLGEYFEGWVPVSFSTVVSGPISSGQTIAIHVRRESADDSNFNPWVVYNGSSAHDFVLSTPGEGGSGSTSFVGLTDTPSSYAGENGKLVAVNGSADGLEFVPAPSGGGDISQGGTGADGQIGVWLSWAGKTMQGLTPFDAGLAELGAANSFTNAGLTTFAGPILSTGGSITGGAEIGAQGPTLARLKLKDTGETGAQDAYVDYEDGILSFETEVGAGPAPAMSVGRLNASNGGLYVGLVRPGTLANGTITADQSIDTVNGPLLEQGARALTVSNALTLAQSGGVGATTLTLTGTQSYAPTAADPVVETAGSGTLTLLDAADVCVVTMVVLANTVTVAWTAQDWKTVGSQVLTSDNVLTIVRSSSGNQYLLWSELT